MMNVQFPSSPSLHLITVAINKVCRRLPSGYCAVVGDFFGFFSLSFILLQYVAFRLSSRARNSLPAKGGKERCILGHIKSPLAESVWCLKAMMVHRVLWCYANNIRVCNTRAGVLDAPGGYSNGCAECKARLNALNICRQSEHYCTP